MLNVVITTGLIILIIRILIAQLYYSDLGFHVVKTDEKFRYALSLSPFTSKSINEGYTYEYNDKQINTMKELEQLYIERGATEMYVRIATKRSVTQEDITDGEKDTNANVHTFDQAMVLCQIAADLNIPINPEVNQAPRFNEYNEIYKLQRKRTERVFIK